MMTEPASDVTLRERRRGRLIASPRARRAIRQRGIDPASISGSGPGGRIVEADVLRAAGDLRSGIGGVGRPSASALPAPSALSARHAVAGLCFSLRATADVTSLVEIERQIAADVQRACGTSLRFSDFLLRAMGMALADCPHANRVWRGAGPVESASADVALEVEEPKRRVALVIGHADRLPFLDLVRRRAELIAAARAGQLPADASQGTGDSPDFCGRTPPNSGLSALVTPSAAMALCDLTGHPVDECTAILVYPHTSVLAAGRVALRPAAFENRLCLRQTLALVLTVDGRALGPAAAAALLGRIVELLERPFLLLCERLRA